MIRRGIRHTQKKVNTNSTLGGFQRVANLQRNFSSVGTREFYTQLLDIIRE